MSDLTVGLTGGIAAGKSTVAAMLRDAGLRVVDADDVVAELHAAGGAGAAAVRQLFGESFLTDSGAVDHSRLAEKVFADPVARRSLEAATHPLVGERFAVLAAQSEGIAVLEASLLVESGLAPGFSFVVTVEADAETRVQRAVERGLPETEARARMAAQASAAHRRAAADRVIHNDAGLTELSDRVAELVVEITALAAAQP